MTAAFEKADKEVAELLIAEWCRCECYEYILWDGLLCMCCG